MRVMWVTHKEVLARQQHAKQTKRKPHGTPPPITRALRRCWQYERGVCLLSPLAISFPRPTRRGVRFTPST